MAEPTQPTIPGASRGLNGLLSVTGYGSFVVRVEKISYGLELMTSEAQAANFKVFYPHAVLDTQFGLTLIFLNWSQREAFNKWMSGYMRKVTTREITHGAMRVSVPARRFVRIAVPQGTLDYGDDVMQAGKAYRTEMRLSGAANPILSKNASSMKRSRDPLAATFYPANNQLSGMGALASVVFDAPVTPPATSVPTVAPSDIWNLPNTWGPLAPVVTNTPFSAVTS